MKKYLFLGLAALGMLATSCLEEQNAPVEKPAAAPSLVASMEQGVQTRTTVDEDNNLLWAVGDALAVPYGEEMVKFVLNSDDAGKAEGEFVAATVPAQGAARGGYAYYPYNAAHTAETVTLPAEYVYEGEYTPNTNALMVADLSGNTVQFKHMGGVVRIDLNNMPVGVKAVRLTANKGINGEFAVSEDEDGNLVVNAPSTAQDANKTVTIRFASFGEKGSRSFYFPLPIATGYKFKVEYQIADDSWVELINTITSGGGMGGGMFPGYPGMGGTPTNNIARTTLLAMPALDLNPVEVNISSSEITSVDAKINIKALGGATGEFVYHIQSFNADFDSFTDTKKEQQLNSMISSATSSSTALPTGGYDGKFSELCMQFSSSLEIVPGQTYFIAVLPKHNKTSNACVYELVTLKWYTLTEDSSVIADDAITFTDLKETFTSVSAKVNLKSGSDLKYRFTTITEAEYSSDYEGDTEGLMNLAIGTNSSTGSKKASSTCSISSPEPETSYMIIVYVYNSEGVGRVFMQKVSCPALTYSDAIQLEEPVVTYTGVRSVDIKIKATGDNLKSIRYGYINKTTFDDANGIYKGQDSAAELELIKNLSLKGKKTIAKANFAGDDIYNIDLMYFMEEQYLFIIAIDENDMTTHAKKVVINTATPFETGFDENLKKPEIRGVYYVESSNKTEYGKALNASDSKWVNMNTITDVETLNGKTGFYQLDINWETEGIKNIWLCSDNKQNYKDAYALSETDMKANAKAIIAKRYGTTAGSLQNGADFRTYHVSEYKLLREKNDDGTYSAKTIYCAWETVDGKFGYMPIIPEEYASPDSGETPDTGEGEGEGEGDTPTVDPAGSPWGQMWLYKDMTTQPIPVYYLFDLAASDPEMVYVAYGPIEVDDDGVATFERVNNYSVDLKTLNINKEDGVISWEDKVDGEYSITYMEDEGMMMMVSANDDTYTGIQFMTSMVMCGLPAQMGFADVIFGGGTAQ